MYPCTRRLIDLYSKISTVKYGVVQTVGRSYRWTVRQLIRYIIKDLQFESRLQLCEIYHLAATMATRVNSLYSILSLIQQYRHGPSSNE